MLSVIIPACQEENYIEKTLQALKKQSFKDFETIVICNGCKDKTSEIAKKYADKVLEIKERNVSKARNAGAKIAKGQKLVFLDADIKVTEETLKKIAKSEFEIGSCKAKPDNNKLIAKSFMIMKNLYQKTAVPIGFNNGSSTGLIFCNKKVFEKVKGFNENMAKKEDSDFVGRVRKFAKYGTVNSYVINCMRRFEKLGYWQTIPYWILANNKQDYDVIR